MHVDQCEVWITSEGQRLPEYQTTLAAGDDGRALACFIPSEAGKGFAVEWRNTSLDHLSMMVKLDGDRVGSRTWCSSHKEGAMRDIRTSSTTKHTFQFSKLLTTDVDDALHAPANEDLGTICVEVQQVQLIPKSNTTSSRPYMCTLPPVGLVHERSKKAGTHCVTLGEAIEKPYTPGKWTIKDVEPDGRLVAQFLFRYKSLGKYPHLQAQGIAPLPIQPLESSQQSQTKGDSKADNAWPRKRRRFGSGDGITDEESDVKPPMDGLSDDDEDELTMLKGQLSQIMDRITRMEQKKKRRKEAPRRAVKEEHAASGSSAQLRMEAGDVIDLTLSD